MVTRDEDFDRYLTVLKDNSTRTRSIIYINIVLIAIAIAAFRLYTYPGWSFAEYKNARILAKCINDIFQEKYFSKLQGQDLIESDICNQTLMARFDLDITRLKGMIFSSTPTQISKIPLNSKKIGDDISVPNNTSAKNTLDYDLSKKFILMSFIDKVLKNEADNRTAQELFQIPLLGIYLHQNDQWVLTGFFCSTSMLLLSVFMRRELKSIDFVKNKIQNEKHQFLFLSSQIFSLPLNTRTGTLEKYAKDFIFLLLFFLPFIIHLLVLKDDFDAINYTIVKNLIGEQSTRLECVLEVLTGLILFFLSWDNYRIQNMIEEKVKEISDLNLV